MFGRSKKRQSQQPAPAPAPQPKPSGHQPSQQHHANGYHSNHNQQQVYPNGNQYHQYAQTHQPPPPPQRHGAGQRPPPPGADIRLWQVFLNVDKDGSGSIDARELQTALINSNWTTFDWDTICMLFSIFDTNRNGTIGFNEFNGLFKYIEEWQRVFKHWDTDQSGTIEERELAGALNGFGYNLSPQLIQLIVNKYSGAPISRGYGAAPPAITFDRFIRACVVVKQLSEAFRAVDKDNDGWIQISYEQFMGIFLRAP
ncbi:hypothetical protein FRC16_007597 [Serendipita sp. 398]|nr:hypothetical protein FRC16_007597 [Serendipita sp. 398]